MIKIMTLFFLQAVILTSCGYRNSNLGEFQPENSPTTPSAPIVLVQNGSDLAGEEEEEEEEFEGNEEVTADSLNLNNLLSIYLGQFIKEVIVHTNGSVELITPENKPEDYKYDTRVDYQGMYKLYKNKDKNYKSLISKIKKEFKNMDLKSLSDKDQLAFYINAYNFFAMDVIVRSYKKSNGKTLKSIKEIKPTLLNPYAIFSTTFIRLSGVKGLTTLDHIEKTLAMNLGKKILNGKIDARLHFAIICASIGCPVIPAQPFEGDSLDEQLNLVTSQGLKLKRMFELKGNKVIVSNIFEWYKNDFSNDPNGPSLNFLKHHTNLSTDFSSIGYNEYDWKINAINGLNIKYELPELSGQKKNKNTLGECQQGLPDENVEVIASCSIVETPALTSNPESILKDAQLCLYKKSNSSSSEIILKGEILYENKNNKDLTEEPLLLEGLNNSDAKHIYSFQGEYQNLEDETIDYTIYANQENSSLKLKMTKSWFLFGTTVILDTQLKCNFKKEISNE